MLTQIVTFNLRDLTDRDYRAACEGWAPPLATVPGLLAKTWLADEATNTYGGVYTWRDQAALEAFGRSEFFAAFASNPNIANIAATTFEILEGPSAVTHFDLAVAA